MLMRRHAFLLLGLAACLGHAAPVSIMLRDSVRMDRPVVTLADIAAVTSSDAALAERFGATRLLMLGQRGQPVRLTRERIRYALDKRLPGLQDAYQLGGAPAVRLIWYGNPLDGAAIQAWATARLNELLRERHPEASLDVTPYPLSQGTPLHVQPGIVTFAMRHVQPELTERIGMLVDVLVDGTPALSVPVWLRVHGSRPAWRFRRNAAAGALLDADLLELVSIPVSHERLAGTVSNPLTGASLRHARDAGSMLLADDIDQKKPVVRGGEILVRAVRGNIAVEDRGVALNEAGQGGRVRVVNPRTQASYLATVVGDGVAEVK